MAISNESTTVTMASMSCSVDNELEYCNPEINLAIGNVVVGQGGVHKAYFELRLDSCNADGDNAVRIGAVRKSWAGMHILFVFVV